VTRFWKNHDFHAFIDALQQKHGLTDHQLVNTLYPTQ